MKLQFRLSYNTRWGEELRFILRLTNAKGHTTEQLYPMTTFDGNVWTGEVILTDPFVRTFEYQYVVCKGDEVVRREWCRVPRRFATDGQRNFFFPDHWNDLPQQAWLYTSAFTRCVMPHCIVPNTLPYFSRTLLLKVRAPQLKAGQTLGLLGNQPVLGNWNPQRVLRMSELALYEWGVSLSVDGLTLPVEYKYVIVDEHTGALVEWESGDNRTTEGWEVRANQILVVTDGTVRVSPVPWKGAGVVVPVFALRSEESFGVGDFGDLKRMVDWAAQNHLCALQLLPVNDTTFSHTWHDSYPYSCISAFALHPQYADISRLPKLKDTQKMAEFQSKRAELNALSTVDYEAVNQQKLAYLHLSYLQDGEHVLASKDFEDFFKQNEVWLVPYAAFCYLRDKFGTSCFDEWPQFSTFERAEIQAFCSPRREQYADIAFHYYIQYILHCQLSEASACAREKGVVLKGDLPVGVSRYSVDVWVSPSNFNTDVTAGAPPDDFAADGQNWGFPTYNWTAMQEDGYAWWTRRLQKMADYFDAFRIDHVLGFFRIWEIPATSVTGLLGQFAPALPMSADEIGAYGLTFRKDLQTRPCISNQLIEQKFGSQAIFVKQHYLKTTGFDHYEMKPEYDTQRKVQAAFQNKTDENSRHIRDGLYSLLADVLFVPDHQHPDLYHPRIAAQKTGIYQALTDDEREAFDRLYEDYFFRRHNSFWYTEAMQKLPVLVLATDMLPCAEDLGMVPDCVQPVLDALRILTLEIQTMPKEYGVEFGPLEKNPYRSVATIATHDMATLRAWWEEDAERAQRYYNQILQKDGQAPVVMPAWLCEEVVARHLYSPSMLCLFSLQDWLSIDETVRRKCPQEERINVPSDPHNNWNYRMHISIENLMKLTDLNNKIRELVRRSGR